MIWSPTSVPKIQKQNMNFQKNRDLFCDPPVSLGDYQGITRDHQDRRQGEAFLNCPIAQIKFAQ